MSSMDSREKEDNADDDDDDDDDNVGATAEPAD